MIGSIIIIRGGTRVCDTRLRSTGLRKESAFPNPGCWSEGDTEEEAIENIRDAIREYRAALDDQTGARNSAN